jgi:Phage phiEco32-like COOH.NH2 ligase-type 2
MGIYLLHSGQPSAKRLLKRLDACTGIETLQSLTNEDMMIRWGSVLQGQETGVVVNPRQAILNTQNRMHMMRMLNKSGIRIPFDPDHPNDPNSQLPTIVRHYRVPVFDLRPLTCFRSEGKAIWLNKRINQVQDKFREVAPDHDSITAKVCLLAAKALHVLGLDFGLVSIGTSQKGFIYVLDVTPSPILTGRLLDVFVQAMKTFIFEHSRTQQPFENFKMGTDLEFMLRNQQGKMILASKYFPRNGSVGCDARSIQRDGKRFPLAELRPKPADTPTGLYQNINQTLEEAIRIVNRQSVEWLAGSMPFRGYPIGGHIHFSNIPFSSRFVKALNTYLAIPVLLIEDPKTSTKRRPKYGFLGDIRHKDHGGFEYRTPGSWIVNPDIAQAVLCLAYIVARHHRELTFDPFVDFDAQLAFYSSDKQYFYPLFERIWDELSELSSFKEYQAQLQIIADMVYSGKHWDETSDLKKSWGIVIPKKTKNTNGKQKVAAWR